MLMSAGDVRASDIAQLLATVLGSDKEGESKDPAAILDRALASVFDPPEP